MSTRRDPQPRAQSSPLRATAVAGVVALLFAFLTLNAFAPGARAATRITDPGSNPYRVAVDAAGKPVPFTIVASGFPAGRQVFLEQCDGRPATATNWSVTEDCDDGGSPAPAIVDAQGVVRFPATDRNHFFQPVLGTSPSSLFNCEEAGGPAPTNGLPTYSTCQVRISTNNTQLTADQVFLSITFGSTSSSGGTSSTGKVVGIVVVVVIVAALAAVVWSRRRRPVTDRVA